jgi:phosphoribosylformimino-5-aminoimidazole carboxamide ribotide isomerase
MILFPAIDLKDGQCVRLVRGDMTQATVFNDDPAAQAEIFARQGFQWLHVVDLDGAFQGKPANAASVEAILERVPDMKVQLGGGIRDMKTVDSWLRRGVTRVIIAVGIDARDGRVAVEGWARMSEMTAEDLARVVAEAGVAAIVYTDISRDGVLKGLNVEATLKLARAVSIPVIASGGLASIADVERLLAPDCAILEGAISGRALYDGRLDPKEAMALIATRPARAGAA